MDDLNRHATCSRILRNLLRENRGNDASGDSYRTLVEVHGVKVFVQHIGSEDRVKDMVMVLGKVASCSQIQCIFEFRDVIAAR